jgi:hypothetical protein
MRLDLLPSVSNRRAAVQPLAGGCGLRDHPRIPGRRRLLRPDRAQHRPRRRREGQARRVLGSRPALQLPRGRPRGQGGGQGEGPRGRLRLLLAQPLRPRQAVRRLGDAGTGRVAQAHRARADDEGLVRGPEGGHPEPARSSSQGVLRRSLDGRSADGGLRELGLRQQSQDEEGRRLPAMCRLRRSRHHAEGRDAVARSGQPVGGAAGRHHRERIAVRERPAPRPRDDPTRGTSIWPSGSCFRGTRRTSRRGGRTSGSSRSRTPPTSRACSTTTRRPSSSCARASGS